MAVDRRTLDRRGGSAGGERGSFLDAGLQPACLEAERKFHTTTFLQLSNTGAACSWLVQTLYSVCEAALPA